MRDCDYCSGTGEVPESSTRYMTCPKCEGRCVLEPEIRNAPPPAPEPPRQASLFGSADLGAFDPK